ncbi:MAG TPA: hypothetical protein VHY30_09940 [Verrucomicrobiae bacterium]|jgi:hypothetical protein|nr:hypothetical protein [Verrucomicrobiae bacterium]
MPANIRNLQKICAFALAMLTTVSQSNAASYYIDYAGGSDANPGTSTSTAWKHCPGDPSATGSPASTSLSAGDTVIFKGGVSYILTATSVYSIYGTPGIAVLWSGIPGNPITYDGNSAGSWGTGKALITDNYGTNNHLAFFYHFGQGSNTMIRNFDIGRMGGALNLPPDTGTEITPNYAAGIYAEVGFQNVTIADCYFHELGYWQNVKPCGNNAIGGHGIRAAGAASGQAYETSGLIITNCELTKVRQPIQIQCFKSNNQIEIVNCFIHDYMEWCMDLPVVGDGAYWDNMNIHGCTFSNYDVWYGNTYWTGYQASPHQNGIYWRADVNSTAAASTNINFYDNTFVAGVSSYAGGTSALYLEGPEFANIYNNVFVNIQPANGCVVLQVYQGNSPINTVTYPSAHLYNNSFYSTSTSIYFAGGNSFGGSWQKNRSISITNNIFVNPLTGVGYQYLYIFDVGTNLNNLAINGITFNSDYNAYDLQNNQYAPMIGNNDGAWVGFGSFNWDAHSLDQRISFINAAGGDLHLPTNSPAIGAGMNLTGLGLPGLSSDKDGNPRPPIGSWTLGAYLPIGSSLLPYASLVALPGTIINGQSTTLTWMSINATNLVLNGIGQVALNGSRTVSPVQKTTYVITATGTNGTQSASAVVLVRPTPPGKPITQ